MAIAILQSCTRACTCTRDTCISLETCGPGCQHTMLMPRVQEPYHTFGQRWGAPAFGQYVKDLERQADEVLAGSGLFEK